LGLNQLEDIHWFLPKIITVMKRSHFKTANTLKQAELNLIKQALDTCQGNVTHAARLLGIHRSTIHNKLKKNKF
jgi:transcriptional regulator of acetoin/glycerol metabolism